MPKATGEATPTKTLSRPFSWKVGAAMIWLAFSLALACWWVIFGLSQIERISQLAGQAPSGAAEEIARRHRMLLSEGATLVLLLLGGGIALLYQIRTEIMRARRLREFFAAFTHDIKTSLASLRLQAESLEEDSKGSGQEKLLRRLVKDTVRLELQLENSLLFASPDDNSRLFFEVIHVAKLLEPMLYHWPELKISVKGDALVFADHRALESIIKNLMQNAVVHGHASVIEVDIKQVAHEIVIRVQDNGSGFKGDRSKLGTMFERHGTTSGSGLGLYLSADLAKRLKGQLRFSDSDKGFLVEIVLPEVPAIHGAEAR